MMCCGFLRYNFLLFISCQHIFRCVGLSCLLLHQRVELDDGNNLVPQMISDVIQQMAILEDHFH
jgi:hypothetical protein